MTQHIHEVIAERDRLRAVNAALVAALKLAVLKCKPLTVPMGPDSTQPFKLLYPKWHEQARAAIAQAEQAGKGVK